MRPRPFAAIVLCGLTLAIGLAAHAGTLRIGAATVQGNNVTIPVVLDGDVGAGVSSVDFKFTYDPAVLEPVDTTAGAAATAAGKQVQTNTLEPGQYKVVMFGLNQTTIASGEVAQITMRKIGNSGTTDVSVVEPNFADPNAMAIPSSGSSETLRLDASQEQEEPAPDKPNDNSQNPQENPPGSTPRNPSGSGLPPIADGSENPSTDSPQAPGTKAPSNVPVRSGAGTPSGSSDPSAMQRLAKALEATGQARNAVPSPATPETQDSADPNTQNAPETPSETPGTPRQTLATLKDARSNNVTAKDAASSPAERQQVAALDPVSVGQSEEVLPPLPKEAPSTSSTTWFWMGGVILVIGGLFVIRRKLFS